MRENFPEAFRLVVGHEGGFQDDRRDRGNWTTGVIGQGQLKGTKFGVSAMSYPDLDIKNLTVADAEAIYRKDFWNRVRGDDLPAGVDYFAFDSAVQHGNGNAAMFLQRAVKVKDDGAIGPVTLAAIKKADSMNLIREAVAHRGRFYALLDDIDDIYALGWMRRLVEVAETSLRWASKTEPVIGMSEPTVTKNPPKRKAEDDRWRINLPW